ncbi:protein DMP8-like [Cornus florida]|uniref:protein DMP8-like n=1 Tax=Cornus florida TaxID=4283 RepID=UPI0028966196|nr:protein DMP8-like [Cornus florida]
MSLNIYITLSRNGSTEPPQRKRALLCGVPPFVSSAAKKWSKLKIFESKSFRPLVPQKEAAGKPLAKGMQKTFSKASTLANFLPTGTLLIFETVLPSVYHNGSCTQTSTMMTIALLGLCSLSCFFFHFTDSFHGSDGEAYYGCVTPKGLKLFNIGNEVVVPDHRKFYLGFREFVHAIMSVMVFMAFAFSDHRVTDCVFPGFEKEMYEMMESFPWMIGFVCSSLFFVLPAARSGMVRAYKI